MKIANDLIGRDHPPYVIAEMSGNHNGSLERSLKSIEAAKLAGANAVKIQTYTADTMTIDSDKADFLIKGGLWDGYKLYDLYKWAHTPYEWHQAMFEHAKEHQITLFSTPFDETAVDLLESLGAPAYKIASFEIVDIPLIKYAATTGKPMIISSGMANKTEVQAAIDAARSNGCKDLVLLHCNSSYPTPIEHSNLNLIPELAKEFEVNIGLSDHTMGTTAAIVAVTKGARVIEKHFTLSRSDKGPDSEFSMEPDELATLCTETKNAWLALGSGEFKRQDSEKDSKIFRRSIYFVKDLSQGHLIEHGDIRRIRPGYGLAPKHFDELIGKKLTKDVERGSPVSWDVLD